MSRETFREEFLSEGRKRGYSGEALHGFLGNVEAESRYNFSAINPNDNKKMPQHPDSIGAYQWNGDRALALKDFAKEQGTQWSDPRTQARFIFKELETTEKRAERSMRSATTIEQGAESGIHFARPAGYTPDNPRGGHNFAHRLDRARASQDEDNGRSVVSASNQNRVNLEINPNGPRPTAIPPVPNLQGPTSVDNPNPLGKAGLWQDGQDYSQYDPALRRREHSWSDIGKAFWNTTPTSYLTNTMGFQGKVLDENFKWDQATTGRLLNDIADDDTASTIMRNSRSEEHALWLKDRYKEIEKSQESLENIGTVGRFLGVIGANVLDPVSLLAGAGAGKVASIANASARFGRYKTAGAVATASVVPGSIIESQLNPEYGAGSAAADLGGALVLGTALGKWAHFGHKKEFLDAADNIAKGLRGDVQDVALAAKTKSMEEASENLAKAQRAYDDNLKSPNPVSESAATSLLKQASDEFTAVSKAADETYVVALSKAETSITASKVADDTAKALKEAASNPASSIPGTPEAEKLNEVLNSLRFDVIGTLNRSPNTQVRGFANRLDTDSINSPVGETSHYYFARQNTEAVMVPLAEQERAALKAYQAEIGRDIPRSFIKQVEDTDALNKKVFEAMHRHGDETLKAPEYVKALAKSYSEAIFKSASLAANKGHEGYQRLLTRMAKKQGVEASETIPEADLWKHAKADYSYVPVDYDHGLIRDMLRENGEEGLAKLFSESALKEGIGADRARFRADRAADKAGKKTEWDIRRARSEDYYNNLSPAQQAAKDAERAVSLAGGSLAKAEAAKNAAEYLRRVTVGPDIPDPAIAEARATLTKARQAYTEALAERTVARESSKLADNYTPSEISKEAQARSKALKSLEQDFLKQEDALDKILQTRARDRLEIETMLADGALQDFTPNSAGGVTYVSRQAASHYSGHTQRAFQEVVDSFGLQGEVVLINGHGARRSSEPFHSPSSGTSLGFMGSDITSIGADVRGRAGYGNAKFVISLNEDAIRRQVTEFFGKDLSKAKLEQAIKAKTFETLSHELGHAVDFHAFSKADAATQAEVLAGYDKWIASSIGRKHGEALSETAGPVGAAIQLKRSGGQDTVTVNNIKRGKDEKASGIASRPQDTERTYYYRLSEYLARQTELYASNNAAPTSLADRFFKGISDIWKTFTTKYLGGTNRQGDAAWSKFLSDRVEQAKANRSSSPLLGDEATGFGNVTRSQDELATNAATEARDAARSAKETVGDRYQRLLQQEYDAESGLLRKALADTEADAASFRRKGETDAAIMAERRASGYKDMLEAQDRSHTTAMQQAFKRAKQSSKRSTDDELVAGYKKTYSEAFDAANTSGRQHEANIFGRQKARSLANALDGDIRQSAGAGTIAKDTLVDIEDMLRASGMNQAEIELHASRFSDAYTGGGPKNLRGRSMSLYDHKVEFNGKFISPRSLMVDNPALLATRYIKDAVGHAAFARDGFQSRYQIEKHIKEITLDQVGKYDKYDADKVRKEYTRMADITMNVFGRSNGDDLFRKFGQIAANHSSATSLGMAGLAQVGDIPKSLLRIGVSAMYKQWEAKDLVRILFKNDLEGNALSRDLEVLGVAGSVTKRSGTVVAFDGMDHIAPTSMDGKAAHMIDKVARGMQRAAGLTAYVGLMGPIQDFLSRWVSRAMVQKLVDLNASGAPVDALTLKKLGVRADQMEAWKPLLDSMELADNGVVIRMDEAKMARINRQGFEDLVANVDRVTRTSVLEPTPGVLPYIMGNTMGRLALQFKSYSMAAHVHHTLWSAQMGPAFAFQHFLLSQFLGTMAFVGRATAIMPLMSDEDLEEHMQKTFDPTRLVASGFERGSFAGIIPMVADSMLQAASPFTGMEASPFTGRTTGGRSSLFDVPVKRTLDTLTNLPGDLANAAVNGPSKKQFKDWAKLAPLNNTYGMINLQNRIASELQQRRDAGRNLFSE